LVEAILRAEGYSTYRSPEGADKGVEGRVQAHGLHELPAQFFGVRLWDQSALLQLASGRGETIDVIHSDWAKSGGTANRAGYQSLLRAIEDGQVAALVAYYRDYQGIERIEVRTGVL
jgi:hypothetical protein